MTLIRKRKCHRKFEDIPYDVNVNVSLVGANTQGALASRGLKSIYIPWKILVDGWEFIINKSPSEF